MEAWLLWFCEHADLAPLIIFSLLFIAGFSLPVSEDLILLASGVLASTVMPEKTVALFLAAFLGSYASDGVAYALGRFFGKKIFEMKWFGIKRLEKLQNFYAKYGVFALMVGRCIPFGLRNGIFMTAGVGKMHFGKFMLSDGIACFLFSALLFFLAYSFSSHTDELVTYVQQGGLIFLVLASIGGISFYFYSRRKKQAANQALTEQ